LTFSPAAADTLVSFFQDTDTTADDYDIIFTGDLGRVGTDLLYELMSREGFDIRCHHSDCGMMIYDLEKQDVHSGGSGCGCSASILNSYIMHRFEEGQFKNILFMSTGALMSPTSSMQGESIPSIAHLINIRI
jgi:stage V sporulation protein AD